MIQRWLVCVVVLSGCEAGSPVAQVTESELRPWSDVPALLEPGGLAVPRRLAGSVASHPQWTVRHEASAVPPPSTGAPGFRLYLNQLCNSNDLVGLSGAALVSYLEGASYDCLYYLWSYDGNLAAALTDGNVSAVANAVPGLSNSYAGTDNGVRELLYFLRIAYYHSFYQSFSFSPSTLTAVTTALDAFAANSHFNDFSASAAMVLAEWINAGDAALLGGHLLSHWKSVLNAFHAGRETDTYQQFNAWYLLSAIAREAYYSSFQAAVDLPLINTLEAVAMDMTLYTADTTYLIDEAIYALGQITSHVPAQKANAVSALTDILHAYPNLSEPYLWVVKELTLYNACQTAAPVTTLCLPSLIPSVLASLVPNNYSFDDGAMLVQTAVDSATIQTMYQATRQVQSQLSRIAQAVSPVAGDPNGILHVIVYASQHDYAVYQPLLFDLSAANGGIYIEQNGTFYSYQHSAQDFYTLEELFRHEYTHYLIGRYVVPGMWGATSFYDHHRMVWFDEGAAELLAWSTPTGVLARNRLVSMIQGDATRMTVSQIFQSQYGSDFAFYRYSAMLFYYLYRNDPGKIWALMHAANTNDAATFDGLVTAMSSDSALQSAFNAFLDSEIAAVDDLTDPSTTVPPLGMLTTNNIATIQSAFSGAVGGTPYCTVSANDGNPRFVCRGSLTGGLVSTADHGAAFRTLDASLNSMLATLSQSSTNNLAWATCRFGDIVFNSSGNYVYPSADYYCDGPLKSGGAAYQPALTRATNDFHGTRLGYAASCTASGNNQVDCSYPQSTQLVATSTPDATLIAQLQEGLAQTAEEVYGGRPTLYRNLSCSISGAVQIIPYQGMKYAACNVACTDLY